MQTVFEDRLRRDRRLWIGDLRLQALTNYCTFKGYDLVKRCLFLFTAPSQKDSSLPAYLFEKASLTPATDYIVDYDTLFGVIVHEYVLASGDVETGRTLWPTIENSLKNALSHLDPATFVFDSSRVHTVEISRLDRES
jgi:alpha-L-rhamnosidase